MRKQSTMPEMVAGVALGCGQGSLLKSGPIRKQGKVQQQPALWRPAFSHQAPAPEGFKTVAQILIGLNNKNPESDIRVNVERSEKQRSKPQPPLSSPTPQLKRAKLLPLPHLISSSFHLALSFPVSPPKCWD